MLGLPDGTRACLFDMDGVLTKTATVHAKAWKQMFDEFLSPRGEPEFIDHDYDEYVDGKRREDGVRSFVESRGIKLSEAEIKRLGDAKNDIVQRLIREHGVETYDGSVRYVEAARDAGLRRAVVSSSANTHEILEVTGLAGLFEAVVDGVVAQRDNLPGKPAPDMFLAGARAVDADPAHAAVFEDALAGVQAGRAGDFGCVIGVDRAGQADALREHGADVVVGDLSDLLE